jgi:hypothetical protein
MTIEDYIQQLRIDVSPRQKEREETYASVQEMEATLGLPVVEIQRDVVIVTW